MDSQTENQNKSSFNTLTDFVIKMKPYAAVLWSKRKQLVTA